MDRPLPRRSSVHRYPVLKWFSKIAYDRSYLWSFKGNAIVSALFWGMWIAFLPVVGLQMLIVFFVALGVRANLPLIVALQWISNPFTVAPIYFADYEIGLSLLGLLAIDYPRNEILTAEYDWSNFELDQHWYFAGHLPSHVFGRVRIGDCLGGFVGLSLQRFGQPLQVANNAKPMNVMSKTKPIPFCLVLFALNLLFFAPFALTAKPSIKLGVDYLEETGFEVLKGKRVGLLTHPAGKNGRGQSTVEVLFRSRVVNLVALFGPEHGIYGDEKASVPVDDKIDARTGLPVYSLYGKFRKPTAKMLAGLDCIVIDLQDGGSVLHLRQLHEIRHGGVF